MTWLGLEPWCSNTRTHSFNREILLSLFKILGKHRTLRYQISSLCLETGVLAGASLVVLRCGRWSCQSLHSLYSGIHHAIAMDTVYLGICCVRVFAQVVQENIMQESSHRLYLGAHPPVRQPEMLEINLEKMNALTRFSAISFPLQWTQM